ncbi:hypothetical protein H4R33_004694 [Dimargaris cristalligena]|uniref:ERCC4 domain-containing protein n=1 Tax=Dimargaris cristalligena TaxID=215637 RepID=A0A4P9ZTC0_9FUNG|nr:hypothetical protein H4R33_004694 [Dimargaris cristalligena]RKP36081.1 hypothetical protein BJ085DRAFT_34171 [Dimargaris cristalligena]|eukprot:RKP36081.1 hypothetical protein BJ085DRAFT_34171 [Dimargaris cristalligena]
MPDPTDPKEVAIIDLSDCDTPQAPQRVAPAFDPRLPGPTGPGTPSSLLRRFHSTGAEIIELDSPTFAPGQLQPQWQPRLGSDTPPAALVLESPTPLSPATPSFSYLPVTNPFLSPGDATLPSPLTKFGIAKPRPQFHQPGASGTGKNMDVGNPLTKNPFLVSSSPPCQSPSYLATRPLQKVNAFLKDDSSSSSECEHPVQPTTNTGATTATNLSPDPDSQPYIPSSPESCTSQITDILIDDDLDWTVDDINMSYTTDQWIDGFEEHISSSDSELPGADSLFTAQIPADNPSHSTPKGLLERTWSQPAPTRGNELDTWSTSGSILRTSLKALPSQPPTTAVLRRSQSSTMGNELRKAQPSRVGRLDFQKRPGPEEKARRATERELLRAAKAQAKQREIDIRKANQKHVDKLDISREMTVFIGDSWFDLNLQPKEQESFATQLRSQTITHTKKIGWPPTSAVGPETMVTIAESLSAESDGPAAPLSNSASHINQAGTTVGSYIEAHLDLCLHSTVQRITTSFQHLIRWGRHIRNRYDARQGLFVPVDTPAALLVPESVILIYWEMSDLLLWSQSPMGLSAAFDRLRIRYPTETTTVLLVVQGYHAWHKRQLQKRDREFAKQVRQIARANSAPTALPRSSETEDGQEAAGLGGQSRRARNPAAVVELLSVEEAETFLVWVHIRLGWLINHATSVHEVAQWVTVFTRDLGARRYKDCSQLRQSQSQSSPVPFPNQSPPSPPPPPASPWASQFAIESGLTKAQLNPPDIWRHILLQIPKLTEPVARAIMAHYPTIQSLHTAYHGLADVGAARLLLADITVLGATGSSQTRRVGPKMSTLIHCIFTSQDAAYKL